MYEQLEAAAIDTEGLPSTCERPHGHEGACGYCHDANERGWVILDGMCGKRT